MLTATYCPAYRYSAQSTARGTKHSVENPKTSFQACVRRRTDDYLVAHFLRTIGDFHNRSRPMESLPEKGEMPIHFGRTIRELFPLNHTRRVRGSQMLSNENMFFSDDVSNEPRIRTYVSCRKSRTNADG